MALRLADFVVRGTFRHQHRNSSHGWLELRGLETPLVFDLTGDPHPSLAFRSFEFEARPQPQNRDPGEPAPVLPENIALHQIGPTGDMDWRMVKLLHGSPRDLMRGKVLRFDWKRCLYLEWFSQNSRVVIELPDPIVTMIEGEPLADPVVPDQDPAGSMSVTMVRRTDEQCIEVTTLAPRDEASAGEEREPESLDAYLERLNRETEARLAGFDPAFLAEMEIMERSMLEDTGEVLGAMLDARRLPSPADVDEEHAAALIKGILAELAMLHVAVHLCEHCSMRDAYRYIVGTLLFEERVDPELRNTGWVQNYNYGEECPRCIAEIEAEIDRDIGADE